ncbi:hypothetical protein VPH35_033196 [Triticum aestivum]
MFCTKFIVLSCCFDMDLLDSTTLLCLFCLVVVQIVLLIYSRFFIFIYCTTLLSYIDVLTVLSCCLGYTDCCLQIINFSLCIALPFICIISLSSLHRHLFLIKT